MPKTTLALVKAEGNFYKEQFDKSTDSDLDALIQQRINEAAAEVKKQVGEANYNSTDSDTNSILTTAQTYLAVSKCWQTLHNILIAWDKEQLPSEHISQEQSAENRDYYRGKAEALLALYDLTPDTVPLPQFHTAGVEED